MIPKDFELHERNIRLLRNKREGIVVHRWIEHSAPEFIDGFDKIGYGISSEEPFILEAIVGE